MEIDNIDRDGEDAGGVLRPTLISVFLVTVGIALWGWQDRVDSRQPDRTSLVIGQNR